MAIAYASHSFTTPAAGENAVITKPTGLAEGDILVALISAKSTSGAFTLASGFTQNAVESNEFLVASKIADSGDVAATDFTFSNNTAEIIGGALVRLTGGSTTFVNSAVTTASNAGGSPLTISSGATPVANSLLLMFMAAYNTSNNTQTFSNYAIATSNPTWTELFDGGTSSDVDLWMACAYAVRPEATATGNATVSIATTSGSTYGILITVSPRIDATASTTVATLTMTANTPTTTATANPAVATLTMTANTPTAAVVTPTFSNESKNATTFTAGNKNASTWDTQDKNSSSWTNENK